MAKLYEAILNKRFCTWFKPDLEQAGGQEGRGCPEQLLTIRLLVDYARKTKQSLYIMFIDYVKAYDQVDRNLLLRMLASKGCGRNFLRAIANSFRETVNVIGSESFLSFRGVKQGAANSCSLFTFYINGTIEKLREVGEDGFLGNLHSLLFMDDTVILATSRASMEKKLRILHHAARDISMSMHPTKSQFMTVNVNDNEAFEIENVRICHTMSYTYLGSSISNASINEQVKIHIDSKKGHIRKFSAFLKKNEDAPMKVKRVVLESALKGAILYGCESWLCGNMRVANTALLYAQKQMLGVRTQTCTDLVQVELNTGSAKSLIQQRQKDFFKKAMSHCSYRLSPLCRAVELATSAGSPAGRYLQSLLSTTDRPIEKDLETVKARICQSNSSRRTNYLKFNPDLSTHPMYADSSVPEADRNAFSQLRLSSHFLKIETGRWARIERDRRVCTCGEVQTEEHVLLHCPFTLDARNRHPRLNFIDLKSLMAAENIELAKFCHLAMKLTYHRNAGGE